MSSNHRVPERPSFDKLMERVQRHWQATRARAWQAWSACSGVVWPRELAYRDHPEYKEAEAFRKTFTPGDGDYGWVVEYAKDRLERLDKTFHILDEKADGIIKYLGGGTALVTLGTLAGVTYFNAWLPLLLLPSILCALVAVRLATMVRSPTSVPQPPASTIVHAYQPAYKEKAQATLIGSWEECAIGLEIINQQKAKKVKWAIECYFFSLVLLLLPLVAWPITALTRPLVKQTIRVEIVNPDRP